MNLNIVHKKFKKNKIVIKGQKNVTIAKNRQLTIQQGNIEFPALVSSYYVFKNIVHSIPSYEVDNIN